MAITKMGKTIIPTGATPEEYEIATARFFNELGFDVEFLPRSYDKGVHIPDIKMNNILWEIKSPKSTGKYTISHCLQKALKQSDCIIFDLRRSKMLERKSISQLKFQFVFTHKIKKLLIITKISKLLDFSK
jgi:hypothetical protein